MIIRDINTYPVLLLFDRECEPVVQFPCLAIILWKSSVLDSLLKSCIIKRTNLTSVPISVLDNLSQTAELPWD